MLNMAVIICGTNCSLLNNVWHATSVGCYWQWHWLKNDTSQ